MTYSLYLASITLHTLGFSLNLSEYSFCVSSSSSSLLLVGKPFSFLQDLLYLLIISSCFLPLYNSWSKIYIFSPDLFPTLYSLLYPASYSTCPCGNLIKHLILNVQIWTPDLCLLQTHNSITAQAKSLDMIFDFFSTVLQNWVTFALDLYLKS